MTITPTQLRESAARQRAAAPNGATVPLADELEAAADEIARLRLTDEEFGAVAYGRELIREWHAGDDPKGRDAILRGLLERHRATHNRERD